ncbi:transcriptional regulator ATRX, partial [Trifolium medium]|nr:transcriptional regulator ATRX [Trifolium medium]
MSHQNVIDLDEKDVLAPKGEKDVPTTPFPVVIIDSDDEDDMNQNSFLPFHEVVLPQPVPSPALRMT